MCDNWRNSCLNGRQADNLKERRKKKPDGASVCEMERKIPTRKRGQSLFQSFKPVIKCDNLNSNPKRKFGREW